MVKDPEIVAAHLTAAIVQSRVVGDRSTMTKTITVEETVATYNDCLKELLNQSQKLQEADAKEPLPNGPPLQTAVTVVCT